ncbi:hypothetical protein CHS0354_004408 [Potamilus streckersoni]|uniref:GAIN-B domain-containing protein n=1 Tax=Potamilus streckersoni TaxID=2493646 RepID=A0AAE0T0Y2_9BIVA|nr:hypothetical protein CHS0354_004408 [Potamilus streckersoni]
MGQASWSVPTLALESPNRIISLSFQGTVRVEYEVVPGSISVLNGDLVLATSNQDFVALKSYIDLGDGIVSGTINVQILDDNIPEVDEVFIVRLTLVSLLTDGSPPPRLASNGTVSQVIINANDGTKGIVKFAPDSAVVSVDEISKNISLTVLRDMGTFGDVSIFFYAQSVVDGTNLGFDYRITPELDMDSVFTSTFSFHLTQFSACLCSKNLQQVEEELLFANGENQKVILVEIINDDIPEPDEMFEVILSNPRNGLVLGSPDRASVTILANDVPGGMVRLESDAVLTLDEPGGDNSNMSSAIIVVMRGPGIYGLLNVPFEIIPELAENRNDISPMQGSVTFQDRQSTSTLTLQVLDDTIPEDAERFTLRLLDPGNSAKLGTPVQRTLVIEPNDSPNGLISLYAAGTRMREISVEEGVGMIQFDLVRTQGVEGQVMVDVATEPGTATIAADINQVMLAPLQVLNARDIGGWYTFSANGTTYFLMLKSSVTGELVTRPGSNGSTIPVDLNNLSQTTLFRWQGELTPVQTVETDGVEAAQSFTIDGVTYLIVLNSGNFNRYQTNSRLYRVTSNGILLVLQDIPTKGARNAAFISYNGGYYLIIANALDNSGNSRINTEMYKWDANSSLFSLPSWQSLATLGAESVVVFEVEGAKYLAVANNYDSVDKSYQLESVVYKLGANSEFSQYQRIATMGCRAIRFLQIQSLNLLVFVNNRDNTVSSPQNSLVYRWDTLTQSFILHQRLETNRAEDVTVFKAYDDTVNLAFANGIGNSVIFVWDVQQNQFKQVWTGPPARNLHPVRIQQTAASIDLIAVAEKNITASATIYQVIKVKDSDFAPRTVTMTFDPGQTLLHTTAMVLQDTVPEDTETFYVTLRNPIGGVEIGPNNRIAINILSNDNAHGIIEIAADSLDIRAVELPGRDNTIQINVLRSQGYFGLVSVHWVATGDQNGTNDIYPLEGKVEFATGQSVATISLTIRNDDLPELAEVTYIQLTEVIDSGTDLVGQGAQIGMNKTAKVTVIANDSPYGVVSWETTLVTVQEPQGTDSVETLYIVREQGMMGDLQVTFQTSINALAPLEQQAVSGADYIARQGTVVIQENVTRVPVDIVIRQDYIPETSETFLVNITSVILLGRTPPPGSEPSIKIPGNVVTVTIPENDNANGIVQFNVTTNIEGRIDTYEEYGKNTTLALQVSRSVGLFGPVTVTWQAEPREASILDFAPSSGTLRLADAEQSANIYITIIDDTIPEDMETFDVRLIGISGGGILGPINSVRIAILKNDSPNGLFRFVTTEAVVRESTYPNDPNGQAQLTIERVQGADGVVNVQWRLNAEAIYDFYEPFSGFLLFSQQPVRGDLVKCLGEKTKSLTLTTKPNNILEGEEIFIVSLISADNNADVSPTQGDARVRILPDPGASGTVSILPESRIVYIGEPGESNPNYDGKAQIALTRGLGIYGEITTSWSIVPRDISAFAQVEGIIHFMDLQQTATIIVQALDDTVPELKMTYTLQLVSVTNGAFISKDPGADTSNIVFVASDYPHGSFVFDLPQTVSVSEDAYSLSIPVIRNSGLNGQVLLSYKTYPGKATPYQDYYPVESTLTFQHGENRQIVSVQIIQDTIPEGPEEFYINLTSCRLLFPSDNNYTVVNGLQLDMKPVIGSLDMKIVVIEKNDNAEGTIQFSSVALNFLVHEEDGVAQIPLVRTGGTYSTVSILYETRNLTARANMDYVVPSGQVIFQDGMNQTTINITIIDDTEMEVQEQFLVILTGILGGSLLGPLTTSTVTIAKSDYPNGKFGFKGQLEIFIDNPSSMRQQIFSVERTGGIQGQQMVYWQILGPNNPGAILEATNDIAYLLNGQEVTKGTLLWEDGQSGEKTFTLNIKPFSSWEIQKTFIIQLYKIQGSPSTAGDGEVGPTTGNVTLTISKFGDPNGIVRFDGLALSEREVEEPDGTATLSMSFPLIRRLDTGTIGNIEIFWRIDGPQDEIPDVQPRNGSTIITDEERNGNIVIQILPDDVPELTESFRIVLTRIIGGAELDTQNVVSLFKIRFNDQPHGLFGIIPQSQTVLVDPTELTRFVRVNFTRHAGTFGSVILTFSIKYDIPQSGILLTLNDGTVTFESGQAYRVVDIPIEGTGFLEIGTTFSLSLMEVQYLGSGVTDPPKFQAGETEAKVVVPAVAANSKVGFLTTVASVDEASRTSTLTVIRQGTYGTLEVPWQSGFPDGQRPAGFRDGTISSNSGVVIIPHSVEMKNFTVELIATLNGSELFAVSLPAPPATTVPGGSRLISDKRVVLIEPNGVLRFAVNSTNPKVSELFGKVYLRVIRLYGSEKKIEATYSTYGVTADPGDDFVTSENQAIVMEPGEISATIVIDIIQDNKPEKQEVFFVNLTDVEKFPTDISPSISPRLSSLYAASIVVIEESNDPYGILEIVPQTVKVEEQYQTVNLTVLRTAGIFGMVSVLVRTVGGGESWTSQIVPKPGATGNDTITEILGNRDRFTSATGGQDYEVLDTKLIFKDGETSKNVMVTILADGMPEPDETVIVYLTQPVGGARVAIGQPDGGKKGFSVITVSQNDLSNGIIGFSEDSKFVVVNEDLAPTFTLKLARLEAIFGEVEVSWVAKVNEMSTETQDVVLADQLEHTAGSAICPAQHAYCFFNVTLKNDNIPEESTTFLIKLVSVQKDAKLNNQSLYVNVTVLASDYIRGLIGFTEDSRVVIFGNKDTSVRLKVNRLQGQNYKVEVNFQTLQMINQDTVFGVSMYPALEGEDYSGQTGTLVFLPGRQDLQYIDINLTPLQASSNPYPKQFYVILKNPTNGASLNQSSVQSVVRIVQQEDKEMWDIIKQRENGNQTDQQDQETITKLDTILQSQNNINNDQVTLIENILDKIIDKGLVKKLPEETLAQMFSILCRMLTPDRNDATQGRFSLAFKMENLAYMLVTESSCPTPTPPDMKSLQCPYVKISAGRWPLRKIQAFTYQAQRQDEFVIPATLPNVPAPLDSCVDFHMIEYTSEQWFMKSGQKQLLSSKIISFGIKGRQSTYTEDPVKFRIHTPDRRIATRQAQCVYFDTSLKSWIGPQEVCEVTNDLGLGSDDYVDCSCKHLTHYAVKAMTTDTGLVGYLVWFYVSCFICMSGLALAVLAHHTCSLNPTLSASLLIHMCFACMATEICYVIAAFLSPTEILVYTLSQNNYRCTVMGLFFHYFFLAQFTWIMTQVTSHRDSVLYHRKATSHRDSVLYHRKATSHRDSVLYQSKATSHRDSVLYHSKATSHRDSVLYHRKATSHRDYVLYHSKATSHRDSVLYHRKATSHRDSVLYHSKATSHRDYDLYLRKATSHRDYDLYHSKATSHRDSVLCHNKVTSHRDSVLYHRKATSHRDYVLYHSKATSHRDSVLYHNKATNHRDSVLYHSKATSHRDYDLYLSKVTSHRDSVLYHSKATSHRDSVLNHNKVTSHRDSVLHHSKATSHRDYDLYHSKATSHRDSVLYHNKATSHRDYDLYHRKATSHRDYDLYHSKATSHRDSVLCHNKVTSHRDSVLYHSKATSHRDYDLYHSKATSHRDSVLYHSKVTSHRDYYLYLSKATSHRDSVWYHSKVTSHRDYDLYLSKATNHRDSVLYHSKVTSHMDSVLYHRKVTRHRDYVLYHSKATSHSDSVLYHSKVTSHRDSVLYLKKGNQS